MIVAAIVLPLVMFFAIFGGNVLVNFAENENDQIDAQNEMTETLVGGSGWTAPGQWTVSE